MTNQKNNVDPTSSVKPEAKDPAGHAPMSSGHKDDQKPTKDPVHQPEKARGAGAADKTKNSGL